MIAIQGVAVISETVGFLAKDHLVPRIGPRLTLLVSGLLVGGGTVASSFSLNYYMYLIL